MKFSKIFAIIALCTASITANAQLMYGNTFPFWNVTGPLTVGGVTTLSGALTVAGTTTLSGALALTGVQTFTAQPIMSILTASQAVFTDSSKGLVSNTITGTGSVVMSTTPSFVTSVLGSTSMDAFNTVSTTLNIGGAATTVAIGAATGTTTIANAIVGTIATDSTTSTTGAIKTAGGVGVAKNLVVGAQFIVTATASPAAADACTAGRIVWDASYLYVCTATGVWKRAAITGGY